jgi:homoserine kinase type II
MVLWLAAAVVSDDDLRAALAQRWRLPEAAVEVHDGGMNSSTWFVTLGDRRWVAKAVEPSAVRRFRGGLTVAARLDEAGIAAGGPVPTVDDRFVVFVADRPLALLSWVPGAPLTGADEPEQRVIGATLAAVHAALAGATVDDTDGFHWVDPEADHLSVRPWVRGAVAAAVVGLHRLGPLTEGLLHTDPAPDAFRLDPVEGACGVIDWSVALRGPLLYDVASAVMYVGGVDRAGPLLDAYLERGLLKPAEVRRGLGAMVRFRWAVQADYFARRIVSGDLTGIGSAAENEKGLEDARRWLVG